MRRALRCRNWWIATVAAYPRCAAPHGPPEPNPTAIVQRLWLCPQHLLNPQFLIISSCKFFLWLEMGQAKRRKEQFRKTSQTCALCGARPATTRTRDHVPPKALFPSPRPKLITVPACDICNESASEAEEKFRVYLSVKSGIDTQIR
jgi:hypothetical protein